MFFVPFTQGPGCLSYVFLIAYYADALVTIDDASFLFLGSWSLGFISNCFIVVVALEVYLDTILSTYVFKAFGSSLYVWDDYLSYVVLVASCCCCMC